MVMFCSGAIVDPEALINIGLNTVPNQFCTKQDALELKKLLLLSNGVRGGIVPSSSAVMDMYMVRTRLIVDVLSSSSFQNFFSVVESSLLLHFYSPICSKDNLC